jgi:hypothetical protein
MEGRLQYKDLDLKSLREKCDIDFAHYTYKPGQCSCCYGPRDLPARYWRDGKIKDGDYSFILFKNASNGSGSVKGEDYLSSKKQICISWSLNDKQLNAVVRELRKQVGPEFIVSKPKDELTCIVLKRRKDIEPPKKIRSRWG